MKAKNNNDAVSIFDLDGCLSKENCSFLFAKFLYRNKHTSLIKILLCYFFSFLFKFGFLTIPSIHQYVFKLLIQDKTPAFLSLKAEEFVEKEINSFLYPPAYQALLKALKEEQHVGIYSSSPEFLVKAVAQKLKVCDYVATSYQVDDKGNYLGIKTIVDGKRKALLTKELVQRKNLSLQNLSAYSDSVLDFDLLNIAAFAVAVSPDKKLRELAIKRNWQII
jgi:HAD superfamily hydrolase (TIGR01490 family)